MEIALKWIDLMELVQARQVTIGKTLLTLDGPAATIRLVAPGAKDDDDAPRPGQPRGSKDLLAEVTVHGRAAATTNGGMTPAEIDRLRDIAVELNALLANSA